METCFRAFVAVLLLLVVPPITSSQAQWIKDGTIICESIGNQSSPQTVQDNSGGAIITWSDNRDGGWDIYAQRIDDNGCVLWTTGGIAVCTSDGDQLGPQITTDGRGGAIIAWTDNRNGDHDIYAQRIDADGNVLWDVNGIAVCEAPNDQSGAQIVTDAAGGAIITWQDYREEDWDIYAQKVDQDGNALWAQNGEPVCTTYDPYDWMGNQTKPRIASDGAGGAYIAWIDLRTGPHEIYAQRINADGAVQWIIDGILISLDGYHDRWEVRIIADGTGGAVIAWEAYSPDYWIFRVFTQRVDSEGDFQWNPNGVIVCSLVGEEDCTCWYCATNVQLASDGSAGAIIVWQDYRECGIPPGPYTCQDVSDIYAQRIDSSGVAVWTVDGMPVCQVSNSQGSPQIIPDSENGAIVAWCDGRNGNADIYAQRIDANGNTLWIDNGVEVCTATNSQGGQKLVSDGTGGAIICWQDNRNEATGYDIYALDTGWIQNHGRIAVTPARTIINFETETSVKFTFEPVGDIPEVRGYEVTFSIDPAVAVVDTIVKLEFLGDVGANMFYVADNGGGSYTATRVILGGDAGASGGGDMFRVELTLVAQGRSAIAITNIKLRDPNNATIPSEGVDGEILFDYTPPTMEQIDEPEGRYYNTAPSFSTFGFDDNVDLDLAEYRIDAGGWTTIFSGIDTASWDDNGWVLPGFDGLAEGPHTVYFRVKDDAGYWNGEGTPDTYSWWFIKDTTPPEPPSGFTALPGHEKIHLSWVNPTGDTTFVGVEIRRTAWRDYPEYLPPEPSYPADETEGTFVARVTDPATYDDIALTPRDIYYYAAFAYDSVGNYSDFDADAADRSTNYWLGDVDSLGASEGKVDVFDVVVLSEVMYTFEGDPEWVPACDFGPTDPATSAGEDSSRFGVPLPDNAIGFEDLMIFSMNYGRVDPLGRTRFLAVESPAELEELVTFSLHTEPEGEHVRVFIVMENEAVSLKGVRLVVDCGAGCDILSIKSGSLLTGQNDIFFGKTVSEDGTADISIAALGVDRPLEGSGEIATLLVKGPSGGPLRVSMGRIDLRNLYNERMEIEAPEEVEVPYIPTVSVLFQNHPNPFNPITTILYDVAHAGRVSIRIYDVAGSLIRTLVDDHRDAGRYRVEWDGRNDNGSPVRSGIYFYRLTAPGFEPQAKKMLLLR